MASFGPVFWAKMAPFPCGQSHQFSVNTWPLARRQDKLAKLEHKHKHKETTQEERDNKAAK